MTWRILRQIGRVGNVSEAPPQPAATTGTAADPAVATIQREIWSVLGRAVSIRALDAGSCNGCELEMQALSNPYYNVEGLGIRFVASPRHADLLLVTGPVAANMELAVRRTWEAMPEPKRVVAIGDCGCTGGVFGESYASRGRVANVLPVAVAVAGCPPAPLDILRGILAALRH